MAAGYDGQITIDTRIDAKGMNAGTKSITSSIGGVLRALKFVGAAIGVAFSGTALFAFLKSFNLANSSIGASVKSLTTAFDGLKGAFANLIIQALAPIIPYIITVVQWLTALFTTLAQILGALFGVQLGMSGVADSAGAAAGGMADTAKETKKAAGALAAFDELNVLSSPDAGGGDTGGGGGGGAGGGAAVPALPPINPALLASIEAFKIKFMEFIQPVVDALGRLKDALTPLGETIWAGMKWAWDNILLPLGAWTITDLLPAFIDLLAAAVGLLNPILLALQPIWAWFWDNVLKPLAEWTGGAIIGFLDLLTANLITLGDWIESHPDLFRLLVISAGALALALWLVNTPLVGLVVEFGLVGLAEFAYIVVTALATAATTALSAAVAFLLSPLFLAALLIAGIIIVVYLLITYWDELSTTVSQLGFIIAYSLNLAWEKFKKWLSDLWTGITKFAADTVDSIQSKWATITAWFDANVITPFKNTFGGMWNLIKILAWDAWLVISYAWSIAAEWFRVTVIEPIQTKFNSIWESIKQFAFNAWEYIKTTWKNALAWFTSNVTLPLQNIFQRVWETIKTYASNAWQYITDKFKSMATWAQTNIVDPIKNGFQTALNFIDNLWRNVFNGIVNFTRGIINNVIGSLNDMLSGMTSGMNSMIETANSVGSTLPGWSNIPLFNAPQIPYLAKGAVIPPNASFLAMLGDQRSGNNIEAPESLIRQIVREESGGAGNNITIRFEGSLASLVRELKPYIDKENSRVGGSLLTSGTIR